MFYVIFIVISPYIIHFILDWMRIDYNPSILILGFILFILWALSSIIWFLYSPVLALIFIYLSTLLLIKVLMEVDLKIAFITTNIFFLIRFIILNIMEYFGINSMMAH